MMMKKILRIFAAAALAALFCFTAFAGEWKSSAKGWWWDRGDGTWPANTWEWIDGNRDGVAECYYFDGNGYCLMNTTTPDGYQVDGNGCWVANGAVQTRNVAVQQPGSTADLPEVPVSWGIAQGYNLVGATSLVTSEESEPFGYLNLEPNGTGVIQIDSDAPQYQLTWTRNGDEVHLRYGFDDHVGYYYEDLGQIRLPLGDYVYYFQVV